MKLEITRNLIYLAKCLYPWLKYILDSWVDLVRFLSEYRSTLKTVVVKWNFPKRNQYKCNSDAVVKGNPGPSSTSFYVRNHIGELIHAKTRRIPDEINLVAEVVSLRLGLEYCIEHNLMPICLETDSLAVQKFGTNQ